MPVSPIVQTLLALMVGSCLFAFWKGSVAERIAAALILGIAVLLGVGKTFLSAEARAIAILVGDAVTAIGLLAVVLRYGSLWLGGAMLLYASQFTLHSYYFVTNRPNDLFHAVVNNANYMGIVFFMMVGTLATWLRRLKARRLESMAPLAPAPPA